MVPEPFMQRERSAEADAMFIDRWSPRAFLSDPIDPRLIEMLLEAARWAPSCMNEQPWRFVYTKTAQDHELFVSALQEKNQVWAKNAPVVMFIFAKKTFEQSGAPNKWALFDCGAAWLSIALQARKLGLYSHAMAGFIPEKVFEVTNVPADHFDVAAAVVIGKRTDKSTLPDQLQQRESPSMRKPLRDLIM